MKSHALLALDTSTSFCSVALLRVPMAPAAAECVPVSRTMQSVAGRDESDGAAVAPSQRLFMRHRQTGPESSAYVLSAVREVLAEAGLALSDCIALGYGRGPGSFTGLRTTVGVVQGLAFGADLPVVGIDSLLACAERARLQRNGVALPDGQGAIEIDGALDAARPLDGERTLVAIDARMDEVYWAAYLYEAGNWSALARPSVCAPESVAAGLLDGERLPSGGFALVGNAPAIFGARLGGQPGLADRASSIDGEAMPHAGAVARLAYRVWQAGGACDAALAAPEYVRDKVALTTDERLARRAESMR